MPRSLAVPPPSSTGTRGRPGEPLSLDAIFRPRSVAVIGASRRRRTIGGEIFHNLIAGGFPGPVFPVNPHAPVVQSVRAYPSILDVPDPVDLAVVVVPRDRVLDTVDECGAKGVRGLVVVSAGFAETGPAGKAVQDELVRRVRGHGMRMVGPNCLGLLNTDPSAAMNATFAPTWPPAGPVAFSSQSGALGLAILDTARDLGIGVSEFVSVGNKADVSANDLLEHWEADPRTRVILLYVESFGNPRRFMEIARRVSRKKPIVAVKSGRTEAGARAAVSHTGALAGLDVAVEALLGQAGVTRTDTIEELFDVAMLLANQPVPAGDRVAILTNAGGPGIMASDACESHRLRVPPLCGETMRALQEFLPAEASVRNPVDMIASAAALSYERALRILIDDPGVDAVLVLFVPPIVTEAAEVAAAIRQAGAGSRKPILTCFMGVHGIPEGLSSLREGHFPSYAFPESAVLALARAVRYGEWLRRPEGRQPDLPGVSAERARRALDPDRAGTRWLDPGAVREVLGAYGIASPASAFAGDEEAAAAAAERIGFPVAIKLVSAGVTHKTEVGGVVLGVESPDEARAAFRSIARRLGERRPEASLDGVVVQKMVRGGVETFIGVTEARGFGSVIGFGSGGVAVEIWRDVAFRVSPLSDVDAREMVSEIRGARLLAGFRGAPPADRKALVDALLRTSRLVTDLPEIVELDINPLLALPEGEGVLAIDARIRVRGVAEARPGG